MIAKCDYFFSEEMMTKYYTMRDLGNTKKFSFVATGLFLLITLIFAAKFVAVKTFSNFLMLLIFTIFMVLGVRMIIGHPSTTAEKRLMRVFFGRHGVSVIREQKPWYFREIVTVDEKGITIKYGNKDASFERNGNCMVIRRNWNEWYDVKLEGDMLVVMATPAVKSGIALFGWDNYYKQMSKKKTEDAIIIGSALEGMELRRLYVYIKSKIGKKNELMVK